MLAAGLDGIENDLPLPEPVEENLYHFTDDDLKRRNIPTLPATLGEAIDEMEKDEVVRDALGDHVFERLIEAQRIRVGRLPPPRLRLGARPLPRGVLASCQLSALSYQENGRASSGPSVFVSSLGSLKECERWILGEGALPSRGAQIQTRSIKQA